jgi:hypothetical protein
LVEFSQTAITLEPRVLENILGRYGCNGKPPSSASPTLAYRRHPAGKMCAVYRYGYQNLHTTAIVPTNMVAIQRRSWLGSRAASEAAGRL